MKPNATASSTEAAGGIPAAGQSNAKRQSHGQSFAKVTDGRKQPIRGLWKRGERYYAQLKVENAITGIKKTKRVPLVDKDGKPVETVPQAVAELKRLQTQRADNALPVLQRTDKFADYAKRYLEFISSGKGAKEESTQEKEKSILARWTDSPIGQLRLDQIKRVHVNRFVEARLKDNVSPRTVNIDVITFRVVMKRALSDGLIQRLPTEGLRPLKVTTVKRPLFSTSELEKLCAAAFETKQGKSGKTVPLTENAQQFVDYIRLMCYAGTRRNETLGLKWEDADSDNEQLFIRRQITRKGIKDLKNKEQRVVDFNPKLKALLMDMKKRRAPDSDWIFPSPQRGEKDIPAKDFRESLELVRERAKLQHIAFHDCRHHFISMCVMSGVDFMTIAAWVGHRDGGILIGKVYGHLANEHRKAMAERVNFGPAIVAA
jgi:integrase